MKIYTCNRFTGFYPVSSAAVVSAESQARAATILNAELRSLGLKGDAEPADLIEFPFNDEHVGILVDGDY